MINYLPGYEINTDKLSRKLVSTDTQLDTVYFCLIVVKAPLLNIDILDNKHYKTKELKV